MSSRALSTWAWAKPLTASVMAATRMRAAQTRPWGEAVSAASVVRNRRTLPQRRHLAVWSVVVIRQPYTRWFVHATWLIQLGWYILSPVNNEDAIRQRLARAQKAFADGTRKLRAERQQAVKEALGAGWTKYKIAATMGVRGPTLDSIIKAAERESAG